MKIDISKVYSSTRRMQAVADELDSLLSEMNYYYSGSEVRNKGEFATQYERLLGMIYDTTSDMRNFMYAYAYLVQAVVDNYETLDAQMGEMIFGFVGSVRE